MTDIAAPRISVMIDGDLCSKDHLGFMIDWKRFAAHMRQDKSKITTLHYHGVEISRGEEIRDRPLHDWLRSNGFRTELAEADLDDAGSIRRARVIAMCTLTLDIMKAYNDGQDEMILFTADAALIPVVSYVRSQGTAVTLIYDENNCSKKLRRTADFFIDIAEIRTQIEMTRASA